MKKKRRQSQGSSKFDEHLAKSREQSQKMFALFEEEVSSKKTMSEGCEILDRLVEKELVEDSSPLWCFIVSKLNSHEMDMLSRLANG